MLYLRSFAAGSGLRASRRRSSSTVVIAIRQIASRRRAELRRTNETQTISSCLSSTLKSRWLLRLPSPDYYGRVRRRKSDSSRPNVAVVVIPRIVQWTNIRRIREFHLAVSHVAPSRSPRSHPMRPPEHGELQGKIIVHLLYVYKKFAFFKP